MSKGRREPTKGEKFEQLQKTSKELSSNTQNLAMALRINQLLMQQMQRTIEVLQEDVRNQQAMLMDYQYRFRALLGLNQTVPEVLQEAADKMRVEDFNAECARQDEKETAEIVSKVETNNDVVILTSRTPGTVPDAGILRSRIKIAEMGQPELEKDILGKAVGDKVVAKLNGVDHEIEILGVRRLPKVEEPPAAPTLSVVE